MSQRGLVSHLVLSCCLSLGAAGAKPAANTLTGRVTIFTQAGAERTRDASGVVVFLEREDGTGTLSPPRSDVVVSQRDLEFSPRVLVVTKGTEVAFPNDGDVFHNVFSLSRPRPFDLGVYAKGEERSVTFPRTGLIKVYCNIHPNMVANIVVLHQGLFAVTDRTGHYSITNIPDGRYNVRSWHEFGGEHDETLSWRSGQRHEHDFSIHEDRTTSDHNDKFGRRYSRKY